MDYRLVSLTALCLLTAGCPTFINAAGPPFSPTSVPDGKAVVYFYRPAQKIMSDYALFMSVPESANNCFRLESGGYTAHVVDPGPLVVAGAMVSYKTMKMDVKAGEERYVEIDIEDDDAVFKEVQQADARAKINETLGIEKCSPDEVKKK